MNKHTIKETYHAYINANQDLGLYAEFADRSTDLAHGLYRNGWRFTLTDTQPYATSAAMFADMGERRLTIFSGGTLSGQNPLVQITCVRDTRGVPLQANHCVRAVHDILGHYPERAPFESFYGELVAHLVSRRYYPDYLLPVLFADDIGQLCYNDFTGEFVNPQKPVIMTPRPIGEYL